MVHIDQPACIGCGLCVRDCFEHNLFVQDNKAHVRGTCFNCGHCVAVCPKDACSIDDYPTDGIVSCAAPLSPDALLTAIRSRRSIRQYQDKPIARDVLAQILEAGRFSATGSNAQGVSYIVLSDELEAFKPLIWEGLNQVASDMIARGEPGLYAYRWQNMYLAHRADPSNRRDDLFFEAPVVLILSGPLTDCALAASNIELMAQAYGIGALYSGFIRRGIANNPEAMQKLGLSQEPSLCMLLGYPNVTYLRTVPRKKVQVQWR